MNNKIMSGKVSGFTLIELLVVVLIIGILTSIALPQYSNAVRKSKSAEALTAMKALKDAFQVCYLETDSWDSCVASFNSGEIGGVQIPTLKYHKSPAKYTYGNEIVIANSPASSSNVAYTSMTGEMYRISFSLYSSGKTSPLRCISNNRLCEKFFPCQSVTRTGGGSVGTWTAGTLTTCEL